MSKVISSLLLEADSICFPEGAKYPYDRVSNFMIRNGEKFYLISFVALDDTDPPTIDIISTELPNDRDVQLPYGRVFENHDNLDIDLVNGIVMKKSEVSNRNCSYETIDALHINLSNNARIVLTHDPEHAYLASFNIEVVSSSS